VSVLVLSAGSGFPDLYNPSLHGLVQRTRMSVIHARPFVGAKRQDVMHEIPAAALDTLEAGVIKYVPDASFVFDNILVAGPAEVFVMDQDRFGMLFIRTPQIAGPRHAHA